MLMHSKASTYFSRLFSLLIGCVALASFANAQTAVAPAGYRLAAGDMVSIAVFNEAELSVAVRIGDNGRISYPFLGEMLVAGITPAELEKRIATALRGDYLVDPRVSVTVTEYRPFFVNGQVKNPGSYPFQPGMTVRKAVSLAGGLTERASEKRITLIPESQRGSKTGARVGMDSAVGPGDILTVEESFF
jgi:polysaccharide biosynthesis/export protein VpsN